MQVQESKRAVGAIGMSAGGMGRGALRGGMGAVSVPVVPRVSVMDRVEMYYARSGRDLEEDIMLHLADGRGICVFAPEYMVMARPVSLASPLHHIVNPAHHYPFERAQAWHVHLAVGDMRVLAEHWEGCGRELPHVCFQRGERSEERYLRVYGSEVFFRRLRRGSANGGLG